MLEKGIAMQENTYRLLTENMGISAHVLDIVDSQDRNNLLNLLGTEDFDTFLEEIKEQEKGQALEDGLIEKANQHAKDIILDMFSSFDGYRVVFY